MKRGERYDRSLRRYGEKKMKYEKYRGWERMNALK